MHNSFPLVSVVVPIFNIEAFLSECVESLIRQTYKNIEIILVNDGSTDNCGKICDEYSRIDARIQFIHKNNGGLISARKAGLEFSKGEYVAYVDGDDWVEPEMYGTLLRHAKESNADVVAAGHKENLSGRIEILKNQARPGIYSGEKLKNELFSVMLYSGKFSQFGIFSYVWGKLYKRSVLYNNQMLVDEDIFIGEDAACLYPTLLDSKIVCVIETAHYHYRQRVDSLIKTQKKTEVSKITTFYNFLNKRFEDMGYGELLIPQLQYFALSLLTVRSEGPLQYHSNTKQLYPFDNVNNGDRIVICGAGTFGQHLFKRISSSAKYSIVGWVDEWFEFYNQLGLEVNAFDYLKTLEYDVLVIAFIEETVSNEISQKLLNIGVPSNKITWVSHYEKDDAAELLNEYGIIHS